MADSFRTILLRRLDLLVSVLARVDFGRFDWANFSISDAACVSVLARVDFGRFQIKAHHVWLHTSVSVLARVDFGRFSLPNASTRHHIAFQYSQESILADSALGSMEQFVVDHFSTRKSRFWPIPEMASAPGDVPDVSVLARVDFGRFMRGGISDAVSYQFQYSQESILADSTQSSRNIAPIPRFSTRKSRFWPIHGCSIVLLRIAQVSVLARVDFGRFQASSMRFRH